MISTQNAKMYSEVYSILNILGDEYKSLLPQKLYNFIKENKFKDYTPIYNENIPFSQQDISKESVAFICMLHYNYWCKTEEEKAKINKILAYNEQQKRVEYFKFKKKWEEEDMTERREKTALEVIKETNIFQKILDFLRKIRS